MNNIKYIIKTLCKSPFLIDWILKLKKNEVLFSPKKNINPCIQLEQNHLSSSVWEGLIILNSYCLQRDIRNDEVDEFILSLLNESIDIYKKDNQSDKYLKLNSSIMILDSLLDIILSSPKFINGIDFCSFVEIYLSGVLSYPFSLAYKLYNRKNVLVLSDANVVFEALKKIYEFETKSIDYGGYLVIPEIISRNPFAFYSYSKNKIMELKRSYYDMGSFYEYKNTYDQKKDVILFDWLKISSKNIDVNILENDISIFINEKNSLLNKIGLCLININFEKESDFFLDNINLFFENENFYADLRFLLKSIPVNFIKENDMELRNKILSATFGITDENRIATLRNHLCGILNAKGLSLPFYEEDKNTLNYVVNFNKKIYITNYDKSDDISNFYEKVEEMNIDESVKYYYESIGGSMYFDEVILETFQKYLLEKYPDDYLSHLKKFDYRLVNSFIHYFSYKEKKEFSLVCKLIELSIEQKHCENHIESLSAVIFAMKSIFDYAECKDLATLYKKIDYHFLTLEDYESTKSVVSSCINDMVFVYFELGAKFCQNNQYSKEELLKSLEYFKGKFNCSKFKSILAFIFPILMNIEKEYSIENSDYIFDNIVEGVNLSYPLLAISEPTNFFPIIEIIESKKSFIDYLLLDNSDGDIKFGQNTIGNWILCNYIFHNKNEDIIDCLNSSKQYDIFLENLRSINFLVSSKKIDKEQINRACSYLKKFSINIDNFFYEYSEIDQIIRELSSFLWLLDEVDGEIWDIFLKIFKYFNHFFSNESKILVKKYKDVYVKEITSVLDMYFKSYEQYKTYECTLVDVYNLVKDDKLYAEKVIEWRSFLLDKNIDLKDKIL